MCFICFLALFYYHNRIQYCLKNYWKSNNDGMKIFAILVLVELLYNNLCSPWNVVSLKSHILISQHTLHTQILTCTHLVATCEILQTTYIYSSTPSCICWLEWSQTVGGRDLCLASRTDLQNTACALSSVTYSLGLVVVSDL